MYILKVNFEEKNILFNYLKLNFQKKIEVDIDFFLQLKSQN